MSAVELVYFAPDSVRQLADVLESAITDASLTVPPVLPMIAYRDGFIDGWKGAAECLRRLADKGDEL